MHDRVRVRSYVLFSLGRWDKSSKSQENKNNKNDDARDNLRQCCCVETTTTAYRYIKTKNTEV